MGIFDWLFGKKETPSKPKKDCCSKKEVEGTEKLEEKKNSKSHLRVNVKDLEDINDLFHYKKVLFTGVFYENYPNGNLLYESEQVNGEDHGKSKRYKSDGSLHSIVHFSNGKIHDEDRDKESQFLEYMKSEYSSQLKNNDNPNIEVKINTEDLPESPIKSIDDLDLDTDTMEKLKSMTVQVGEDGVLPGIDMTDILSEIEKDSSSNKDEDLKEDVEFMLKGIDFEDGEEYKLETWRYDNGQIKEIGNSLNSQKVGLWRMYYNNGQLKVETFFNKDFNRDGIYKSYYENGQLKSEENYKDDTVISKKCWDKEGNEI